MTTPGIPPERIAEAIHLAGDTVKIERVAGYDIVETWQRERSGTRFYRFRVDPDGREVLVKTGDDWSADDARAACLAQTGLADVVSSVHIEGAGTVRPYGWVETPPLLVMPFVDGTDLVTLLRDPDRPEWESMSTWIRAAGAMLAAYHRNHPAPPAEKMLEEMLDIAKRMRLPNKRVESLLEDVGWQSRCFGAYGDFGPGNLIGEPEGKVYLIDPPVTPEVALPHRDLGNFIFEVRRQLAGHGFTRSRPVRGRFDGLRQALLSGYSGAAGSLTRSDETVIAMFEMRRAAGMARKRTMRRPGDALWFGRTALARRREVKRLLRQPE